MSGRLCSYKQQQYSKLRTLFEFKNVRLSLYHTHEDACVTAWLSYQKLADPVRR